MRLVLLQRGRIRDAAAIALRDEYVKRFRRYGRLEIIEAEQPRWPDRHLRVLLDERGKELSSPELAKALERWTAVHGAAAFAVGDAYGHEEQLAAQAEERWSLSRLVFPHHLAHVLVAEQLYRAASIRAGAPYHHA
jgi:23S rRNA pseudoU1915 N3-methylase RlmH